MFTNNLTQDQRIAKAKEALRQAENAKTVAETQAATAQEQLDKVIADMAAAGVTPETIDAKIAEYAQKIETGLASIEATLTANSL